MGVTHKQVARLVRERMSVRGGVRFFTVLSSHRGGGGGWKKCVRYLQSRWMSSELQDAAGAGPEPHRHASSWPGGSEESHTHPRLLLRTRGERAISGGEQGQAELARSVCVDTHSMVKSLEQAGQPCPLSFFLPLPASFPPFLLLPPSYFLSLPPSSLPQATPPSRLSAWSPSSPAPSAQVWSR